jgi:hypothetical protein
MEMVIYALSLVEHLVKFGLNYTFKGGTSLLLLLPEPSDVFMCLNGNNIC